MNVIMDYILSSIIFGVLTLTIARVQINLNASASQSTFTVITQSNAVELARRIEFDFLKIGYKVKGQKIFTAEPTIFEFRRGYKSGASFDTSLIMYYIGSTTEAPQTTNPDDYPLYMKINNGQPAKLHYGITGFYLKYYNTNFDEITTPVDSLNFIRSVHAQFILKSSSAVISDADTSYTGISWQKHIIPRNLGRIDY